MRAMVLCAGKGTRLGALCEDLPKPLLDIHGRPILDRILGNLARWGFREVVLNLHHLGGMIRTFVGDGSRWGVKVHCIDEPELAGTAGSVRDAAAWLAGPEPVLVHYGDVVTDQDLGELLRRHQAEAALATLLLHPRPGSNSVVEVDDRWRIRRLLERPSAAEREGVDSPWVNSGVYLLDPSVLAALPGPGPLDFPRDVFPAWIAQGRVFGVPLSGYRCAVDSAERLERARLELRERPWP